MKKTLLAFFLLISMSVQAKTTIKIALLDNLQSEKLATERYVTDYLQGIELGADLASKQGINFETKEFFFGKNNLEILGQIEQIKLWKPDLVIGPRSSELFILLKNHFKDLLVISPFATAEEVTYMPSNFYSVTADNAETVEVLVKYVKNKFPGKSVFQIIQLDCKNCIDSGEQFVKFAAKHGVSMRTAKPAAVISAGAETVSLDNLLKGYKTGDLIQIPNTSFVSGTLAGRIANHLKQKNLTILGCTGWGDWKVGYFGKFPSVYDYVGYRIVTGSVLFKDKDTLRFQGLYKNRYHHEADVNITRINFMLMDGLTTLIRNLQNNHSTVDRTSILSEFLKMKEKDRKLWRTKTIGVFRTDQKGEVLQEIKS